MPARSRPLHLSTGPLSSPLLVPSISSKGFPLVDGVTEASKAAEFASPDIREALLISAYDLHHELLLQSDELLSDAHRATMYGSPELLVIDSGGYELIDEFESGETHRGPRLVKPFGVADFEAVISRLPPERDVLAVNFDFPPDERGDFTAQRARAQGFFARYPHLKSDFLIKPEPGSRFIEVLRLVPEAANLRPFDVIGVTEKELGPSLLDRLITLANLRKTLDDSDIGAPIHVFGALDPLFTPLYFMVGGEIFDGLSWIRYAYLDGVAVHQDALTALRGTIEDDSQQRDARRYISNLAELQKLKHRLEKWAHHPERFELLGPNHESIREIYETVIARIEGRG